MKNNDNNTRANDRLGKANFFLKLATLVATAIGTPVMGLIVSSYLNGRQTIETNARIYTELMSKREESETALRKDMFESIIGTFLKPNSPRTDLADIETKLLNLELLAYNFHESIDLGPLFKHMDRQIKVSHNSHKTEYLKRLKKLAKELSYKQLAVLGEAGRRVDATIEFENTDSIIIDTSLKLKLEGGSEDNKGLTTRDFRLWVTKVDIQNEEIEIILDVSAPGETASAPSKPFSVDFFDFPMIDNTRLSQDDRVAIVLTEFDTLRADISLVYFPGSLASMKEKPYYDEILHQLLRAENIRKKKN